MIKPSNTINSVEKEETVYVNLKTDGTVNDITVSDWLKNITGTADAIKKGVFISVVFPLISSL